MPLRLETPEGLPTESAMAEDVAWSSLVSTQLEDVRKTAENWRNGLLAIVATIAGFSVIKGPADITSLDRPFGYAVGWLLLVALTCGLFGAWSALGAAYGTPGLLTREDFHRQGGIDGYKFDLAVHAAEKLRFARMMSLFTLALLAAAVGLTWYGPRSSSVILKVDRKSAPNLCGKLQSSANGEIDIKPPAAAAVRLPLADLTRIRAADKCDE